MSHHTLTREQRVPGTPDEVFGFFAEPANLEAITPPWLNFRIDDAAADRDARRAR